MTIFLNQYKKWLEKIVGICTDFPYKEIIHDTNKIYDASTKTIVIRYLKTYLPLKIFGQLHLEQSPTANNRILWIFSGKNAATAYKPLGDSIMDLSGRALLKDKNYQIDLLTFGNLVGPFGEDDIYGNIFTRIEDVPIKQYDFILFTALTPLSIRLKLRYFPSLPFASLMKYLNTSNRYNQILLSFFSINDVFNLKLSPEQLKGVAKPYLHFSPKTLDSIAPKIPNQEFIAISVGGMVANKTYNRWPELLDLLDQHSTNELPKKIVLVGASNGVKMAQTIQDMSFKNLTIESTVNQLSVLQTAALISKAKLFVGPDGGSMHIAHATPTPSVTLFIAEAHHAFRLTKSCHSHPIELPGDINFIEPKAILESIQAQLCTTKD